MHMHASQTFITETCNNNYHLLEDVQKHTNEKKAIQFVEFKRGHGQLIKCSTKSNLFLPSRKLHL